MRAAARAGQGLASILAKVGARPEQVNDDAIRLEVTKQIRILELAAEELNDGLLGFRPARNFDLREIGLVCYVIASSERLADALLNVRRYCTIKDEGVRLNVKLDDRTVAIAIGRRESADAATPTCQSQRVERRPKSSP